MANISNNYIMRNPPIHKKKIWPEILPQLFYPLILEKNEVKQSFHQYYSLMTAILSHLCMDINNSSH